MKLSNRIGHNKEVSQLLEMIQNDRFPHALLFHGPSGNGKLQIAIAIAQRLLCKEPTAHDSCGKCSACVKCEKLIHPDLHFSYPTNNKAKICSSVLKEWRTAVLADPFMEVQDWLVAQGAADNQQGKIYKDECVDIVKKLSFQAFEGGKKVLIMWLPEFLANEGNRLLKLIEEPPQDTHFILVSENLELVLTTIISRCQLVHFSALKDEEIQNELESSFGVSTSEARQISILADGNFSLAKKLIEKKSASKIDQQFITWMRNCYRKDKRAEWVKTANEFVSNSKDEQKYFFQYGLHFLREVLAIKYGNFPLSRLNKEENKVAEGMANILSLEKIEVLESLFSAAIFNTQRNANNRIQLLALSIQVHRIFHAKSQLDKVIDYAVATV